MAGTWDFAPNSHVAVELAPDTAGGVSFNGWDFTSKPSVPYRRKFRLKISGMRWRLNGAGNALDVTTDPFFNAGRLLAFYQARQNWDTFTYPHEYLGNITVKFAEKLDLPEAIQNSNGLIPDFEITLIHHNPGY